MTLVHQPLLTKREQAALAEQAAPPCENECKARLERGFREAAIDAHVTHIPPLVSPLYESLDMRCPHGILWHAQPTSEQMARWNENGTP